MSSKNYIHGEKTFYYIIFNVTLHYKFPHVFSNLDIRVNMTNRYMIKFPRISFYKKKKKNYTKYLKMPYCPMITHDGPMIFEVILKDNSLISNNIYIYQAYVRMRQNTWRNDGAINIGRVDCRYS